MGMVVTPPACDFQGLILVHLNLLKDCPVTNDDIKNAHAIFGPDLAFIRGKTVWRKPTRVVTDYVDILWALIDIYSWVTVAMDGMFVNRILFLVSVSQIINFIQLNIHHKSCTQPWLPHQPDHMDLCSHGFYCSNIIDG